MKVYDIPAEIESPSLDQYMTDSNYDFEALFAAEAKFIEQVQEFAKNLGGHELAGKVVNKQYADGYAQYVVAFIAGKVSLIHLPVGDAWRDQQFERLVTVTELRRMVERQDRMNALFGRSAA